MEVGVGKLPPLEVGEGNPPLTGEGAGNDGDGALPPSAH